MGERPGLRWHRFADDGTIPNNQRLDVLVYPQTLGPEAADPAAALEELFGQHGWPAAWRDGVYPFAHYHSVCHETLGIARGRARLRLGGESGIELEVGAGDVLVLPACLIRSNSRATQPPCGSTPHATARSGSRSITQ